MENREIATIVDNNTIEPINIEIDGNIYEIPPPVFDLIASLTEQVKELVEINFPASFDASQKN